MCVVGVASEPPSTGEKNGSLDSTLPNTDSCQTPASLATDAHVLPEAVNEKGSGMETEQDQVWLLSMLCCNGHTLLYCIIVVVYRWVVITLETLQKRQSLWSKEKPNRRM